MNKGQIISVDLIVSVVIFISVFAVCLLVSVRSLEELRDSYESSILNKKVQRISEILVRTQGLPQDWNETSATSIGLAESEFILNYTKILRLKNMQASRVRSLLGLGEYDFFVNITNLTRQSFPEGLTIGSEPTDAKKIFSVERFVLVDFENRREMGVFKLMLWR